MTIDEKCERLEARMKTLIGEEDDAKLLAYLKAYKLALGNHVDACPSSGYSRFLKKSYWMLYIFRRVSLPSGKPALAFASTQMWIWREVLQTLDDATDRDSRDTFKFFAEALQSNLNTTRDSAEYAQTKGEILERMHSGLLKILRDHLAENFDIPGTVGHLEAFLVEDMPTKMAELFVLHRAKLGGHAQARKDVMQGEKKTRQAAARRNFDVAQSTVSKWLTSFSQMFDLCVKIEVRGKGDNEVLHAALVTV